MLNAFESQRTLLCATSVRMTNRLQTARKRRESRNAPSGYDRCDYQFLEYTGKQGKRIKSYTKGCSLPSHCTKDTRPLCQETEQKNGGAICEVTCCSEGICNEQSLGGSVTVASSVVLLTCAVLVAIIL